MVYMPLKVVNLWRKLSNSKVDKSGGGCCAGKVASPLQLERLSHMGQGKGEGCIILLKITVKKKYIASEKI